MPGACPSCGQWASVAERCEACAVTEIEYRRRSTTTGQLLDRILEHDFDCKHYRMDPGDVSVEIREGLKVLEQERGKWEQETRERQRQEHEERARIKEMQRKQGSF
jgi:hypothetical protein